MRRRPVARSFDRMSIVSSRWFWVLLLVGLVASFAGTMELGRILRLRGERADPSVEPKVAGVMETFVFSVLGLLLAFAFTGAAARFDARREFVIAEANAISTSYVRFELLPPDACRALRQRFREYVDARLAGNRALPDHATALSHFERAERLSWPLWVDAMEAARDAEDSRAAILLLPILNETFDLASARLASFYLHPPRVVIALLVALALFTSVLAGWSIGIRKSQSRLHTTGFVVSLAVIVYVTIDLEYPRFGLITVQEFDSVLEGVRARMD